MLCSIKKNSIKNALDFKGLKETGSAMLSISTDHFMKECKHSESTMTINIYVYLLLMFNLHVLAVHPKIVHRQLHITSSYDTKYPIDSVPVLINALDAIVGLAVNQDKTPPKGRTYIFSDAIAGYQQVSIEVWGRETTKPGIFNTIEIRDGIWGMAEVVKQCVLDNTFTRSSFKLYDWNNVVGEILIRDVLSGPIQGTKRKRPALEKRESTFSTPNLLVSDIARAGTQPSIPKSLAARSLGQLVIEIKATSSTPLNLFGLFLGLTSAAVYLSNDSLSASMQSFSSRGDDIGDLHFLYRPWSKTGDFENEWALLALSKLARQVIRDMSAEPTEFQFWMMLNGEKVGYGYVESEGKTAKRTNGDESEKNQ